MLIGLAIVAVLGVAGTIALALSWERARRVARRAELLAADAVERRLGVLEAVADGIYIVDEACIITHVNDEAERLLRAPAAELIGKPLEKIVDALGSELVPDIAAARRTGETLAQTYAFVGSERSIEIRIKPAAHETLIYLRDVSARARVATRLEESEQRLQLVTDNVDAVLWTAGRDARFSALAGGALHELGLRSAELLGESCEVLVDRALLDQAFTGVAVRAEGPLGDRWLRHHLEPILDQRTGEVTGTVGVSIDITELKRAEQRAWEAANRDGLTGLPSRLPLNEMLAGLLTREDREAQFAVLFVDIDRFKTINDSLGHDIGDEVLRVVAARISESVREHDLVARPGGDEFVALLPDVNDPVEVDVIAQRILRAVRRPIVVRGHEMVVGVSVGIAIYPEDGRTTRALVSRADLAMYRAKRRGGNVQAHFEPMMELEAAERLAIETELRHALERNELRVHYQPIVDATSTAIVGCEALVRWQHPARGLIGPEQFLAIAEETGLIVDLDRWVLGEAMRDASALRGLAPNFGLALNVSPRALREPGFADEIIAAAQRCAVPLDTLTIEITEQSAVEPAAVLQLDGLAEAGITIAVDDFGVGYSSLAYLSRLPIGMMKLDRSFLSGVSEDPRNGLLVRSIVAMAQSLALQVVAEGVETEEDLQFIRTIGCDFAQGFCFAHPLPMVEVAKMLRSEQAKAWRSRGSRINQAAVRALA